MAELLNCPFCGGSPNVHGDYERGFKVNHRCVGDSCSLIEFSRNTEAEAIAAWNRRAPSSPSIEREVSGVRPLTFDEIDDVFETPRAHNSFQDQAKDLLRKFCEVNGLTMTWGTQAPAKREVSGEGGENSNG